MRIAICDDIPGDSDRLSELLADYLNDNGLDADVEMFASGEALLEAFASGKYQIIFQDIYMDENALTGMEAAEKIRETDQEAAIIFTTTSLEHGHMSYAVDAAYYLVKPVDQKGLQKALEKCRTQLDRYARAIELTTTNRQLQKVRLRDILYAEVMGHNTLLRTVSGEMKVRLTFGELVEKLDGVTFVPCHRSYIVNLVHVADMLDKDFLMKNGDIVPISKTFKEQAKAAFKSYFWGDG